MKILPELESYRDRLVSKAAAWVEMEGSELQRDLDQSREQVGLLEKSVADLERKLAVATPMETDRLTKRLSVPHQLLELTAAYAQVLGTHMSRRAS